MSEEPDSLSVVSTLPPSRAQKFITQVDPVEPQAIYTPPLTDSISQTKRRNYAPRAIIAMAAIVFVVGISASFMSLQTNKSAKEQAKVLGAKTNSSQSDGSSDVPSESPPTNTAAYQVAPSLPKFIKIPQLSVNARVKALGVNSNNELLAPSNIYDVGWYQASAKPGEKPANGAIVMDGHVHGPTLPGIFSGIKSLKTGDEITIQRGDNQLFKYKVIRVQNYDANTLDMRVAMASADPSKQGLNLITCGGKYDRLRGYSQRTIVFAVASS